MNIPTAATIAMLFASCAAIAQEPEAPAVDIGALSARASAAEAAGKQGEAADAYLELSRLDPDEPDWIIRAADNLGKVGRFNDAMDFLDAARKRLPKEPRILVTLAKTYHLKADSMVADGVFDNNVAFYYEDTTSTAEAALALDEDNREARLLLASARFQLGDLPRALAEAERAVAGHADDYGANAMLGKVTLEMFVRAKRQGDSVPADELETLRTRAENALEAAATADPSRGYALAKLGDVRAWSNDMPGALARYQQALIAEPGASVDHGWLRTATEANDRITLYEGAMKGYAARADAQPGDAAVLQWYAAQAHFDAREWAVARKGFELAMKGRPDFQTTHYWIMQAAYWDGDEDAAARHATRLAETAPRKFADLIREDAQTIAVLRGMAQRRFQGGQLVECRELNHVLALAVDTADEWNNYALLCRDTRKYPESLAAYERALEIEQSPQLLNDAAVILHYHLSSEDNLARARELYEAAIEAAEELLADDELDADLRERTRIGLRDAKNNLRKLLR